MIFILGGQGFIGSAFVRACVTSGLSFVSINRDNYHNYRGQSCDLLINANGNSKKYLAKREPLLDFDASVRSVRASLEDFSFSRYIYLSSCDVYPDCSTPLSSKECTSIDLHNQSNYGFHKLLAEQCVRHIAESWLIFRMGGFVGPGLKKNPIFDILHGGPVWLHPKSALQFLHVDVAAKIMLELCQKQSKNDLYNISGKGLITIEEAIQYSGFDIQVKSGSPLVKYDIAIDKISDFISIPETRQTVFDYISNELQRRK